MISLPADIRKDWYSWKMATEVRCGRQRTPRPSFFSVNHHSEKIKIRTAWLGLIKHHKPTALLILLLLRWHYRVWSLPPPPPNYSTDHDPKSQAANLWPLGRGPTDERYRYTSTWACSVAASKQLGRTGPCKCHTHVMARRCNECLQDELDSVKSRKISPSSN